MTKETTVVESIGGSDIQVHSDCELGVILPSNARVAKATYIHCFCAARTVQNSVDEAPLADGPTCLCPVLYTDTKVRELLLLGAAAAALLLPHLLQLPLSLLLSHMLLLPLLLLHPSKCLLAASIRYPFDSPLIPPVRVTPAQD